MLHHIPEGFAWTDFVAQLFKVVTRRIIFLEDTFTTKTKANFRHQQLPIVRDFLKLPAREKKVILSFLCSFSNRVDGGGRNVPTPCTFLEMGDLKRRLQKTAPEAAVFSEFLGIPASKVYLNTEGVFVVDKK